MPSGGEGGFRISRKNGLDSFTAYDTGTLSKRLFDNTSAMADCDGGFTVVSYFSAYCLAIWEKITKFARIYVEYCTPCSENKSYQTDILKKQTNIFYYDR